MNDRLVPCMKDQALKDRFIELRAQGKSFSRISEEINVSKPTLITWSHELGERIKNLRAIHDEALYEKYRLTQEHELQILSRQLEVIEKELETRPVFDVPTDKLYGLLFKVMEETRKGRMPLTLQYTRDSLEAKDLMVKDTWEA